MRMLQESTLLHCARCSELLFEPRTLPCGASVCHPCLMDVVVPQLPQCGQLIPAPSVYACPAQGCCETHTFRSESLDILLNQLLHKLYPDSMRAYQLADTAFKLASDEQPSSRFKLWRTNQPSENILEKALDQIQEALALAPGLPLVYLRRAQIMIRYARFQEAHRDLEQVGLLNPNNIKLPSLQKLLDSKLEKSESAVVPTLTSLDDGDIVRSPAVGQCPDSSHDHALPSPPPALESLTTDDLECPLCLNLLLEPLTSPCGHTLCRNCFLRSLLHSCKCPLCRRSLPDSTFFREQPTNQILGYLLNGLFQSATASRREIEDRIHHGNIVPLFVCCSIPQGQSHAFHIFEPRYRAMVKHLIETDSAFGVIGSFTIPSDPRSGPMPVGTLARISRCRTIHNSLAMTPKGNLPRYAIMVEGLSYFQILGVKMHPDGYLLAHIEMIDGDNVVHTVA
ncbi:uncharacterized protein BJ171DRAFT_515171 [Polychytrium aggregatum]|uniref:uncharacterized protein n=1 Tax=Polychytrium aggregatum TaxID=110093 RepID=UPI0022FF12BB|nr:uncharacterized protein BJ171DRAFT_515171 [Polychytrium aggregatum]KAI9202196.1 hypothetical protein BJ171DRAFT_515171 [Polychytrium aggregatum]